MVNEKQQQNAELNNWFYSNAPAGAPDEKKSVFWYLEEGWYVNIVNEIVGAKEYN